MAHASDVTLDVLEPLLEQVRQWPQLNEKKRGVFYYKSAAFLHFHEYGERIEADLKQHGDWQSYSVQTIAQQQELLKNIRTTLEN